MSQAKLAREADVSPDTLRKAERGSSVTESVAIAIFEALNKHAGSSLIYEDEVKLPK
jgi:DNA-binding XRE family transcriptional regulator